MIGTVTDDTERAKIVWESTLTGYWFWAEIRPFCPRIKTSWNDLTQAHHLLSLEEYVIVWWALKIENDKKLDTSIRCWLRTLFGKVGQGALHAHEFDDKVNVYGCYEPEVLATPSSSTGGRAAEVVAG